MKQKIAVETPRLFDMYRKEVVPSLLKEFGLKNPMQAPKLEKIVINMGVKEGQEDIKKFLISLPWNFRELPGKNRL